MAIWDQNEQKDCAATKIFSIIYRKKMLKLSNPVPLHAKAPATTQQSAASCNDSGSSTNEIPGVCSYASEETILPCI